MTDDRIARLFRDVAGPSEPDAAFREALFESLVAQMDFGGRTRRSNRVVHLFAASRVRLAWIAIVLLLVAALIAAAGILGRRLLDRVDPIGRSQDAMRHAPPFDIDVQVATSRARYRYDGHGRLRVDVEDGRTLNRPDGSWFLFDGRTYYEFEDGGFRGAFSTFGGDGSKYGGAVGPSRPDSVLGRTWALGADPLSWPLQGDEPNTTFGPCQPWHRLPDEAVAGRLAYHIACDAPGGRGDYWLDQETMLILRAKPLYDDEAVALAARIPATVDPTVFTWPAGPAGEQPMQQGPMIAGSYWTVAFRTPFAIQLGDGWSNGTDRTGDGFVFGPSDVAVSWFQPVNLVDPIAGVARPFTGSADELVAWFVAHPGLRIGPRTATTIGGVRATEFDLDVAPSARLSTCDGSPDFQCVFLSDFPGVGHEQVSPSGHYHVVVLQRPTGPMAFVINSADAAGRTVAREALDHVTFH